YTATVNGSDLNGNPLPAPVSWNFRTAYAGQIGGACPCSIFSDLSAPATEISSGWQTVMFSSPVAITAGTTYIASYHAPNGHYQATSGAYASAGVDNF